MGRSYIAPKIRAAAIADLVAGEQPVVVADRYGLNRDTVRKWKERQNALLPPTVTPTVTQRDTVSRPAVETRQREIGVLILDLLAAKLEASAAIAQAASDPEWLRQQSGSELAALGEWLDSTAFAIGDRLAGRTDRGTTAE